MSLAVADTPKRARLFALLAGFGKDGWALIDQLVISAGNFATMILVARGLSPEAFGWFALAFSLLLFANNFQLGIVTQPHNVLGATRQGNDYARYTTATAVSQLLLGTLGALLAVAGWLIARAAGWSGAAMILPLAPLIFAWQFQEFVRRCLYTQGRMRAATTNDSVTYGTRVIVLGVLWWHGGLTVPSAMYAMAATAALGGAIGLWQIRDSLVARFDVSALRENWEYGKWLVGTELVGYWLSTQLFIYLAAGMVGVAAVGILKAVDIAFGPARVLATALSNVLPIRFATTLKTEGNLGLDRQFRKALWLSVPMLGLYCVLITALAKPALWVLFGDKYIGQTSVLMLYAVFAFVSYLSMILGTALRAKRMTREVFINRVMASAIAIPLGWVLIYWLGIYGAVLGMIVTYLSLCVFYWSVYRRDLAKPAESVGTPESDAAIVLGQFTGCLDQAAWTFERIGAGGQGYTLLASRRDGRRVWNEHEKLVVKIYDRSVPELAQAIDGEFHTLGDLSRHVDGRTIDGWSIHTPTPLFKSSAPYAIVMTAVPGEGLHTLLPKADEATADILETCADAVMAALRPFWSETGRIYGDLHFENILCDAQSKCISFVDPGTPQKSWTCRDVPGLWYPASRDLAYLLFDVVSSSYRVASGNRRGARRQRRLVEKLVRSFVDSVSSIANRRSLMDEIRGCVGMHLSRLRVSLSPAGLWRRWIRYFAARRIDAILDRLAADDQQDSDRELAAVESGTHAGWQGGAP